MSKLTSKALMVGAVIASVILGSCAASNDNSLENEMNQVKYRPIDSCINTLSSST